MTTAPVRVVVADDHPMYRYGVAAVLATADEIELVGEAPDGAALIALAAREHPDVVLTDLAMPGMTGLQLAAAIRADRPSLPVLVATGYSEADGGCDLPRVSKPFLPDDLARAIAACLRGVGEAQKIVPFRSNAGDAKRSA